MPKTGFYEQLHKDFEITRRYDVGLLCGEGFATGAARDLVEKLQTAAEGGSMQLLVLTDLYIGGLGIAEASESGTRAAPLPSEEPSSGRSRSSGGVISWGSHKYYGRCG